MLAEDTIAAPATPLGEGGIGIIRVSGPASEGLLKKLFYPFHPSDQFQSHHLYHGKIFSLQGQCLDEVLAVVMRKPHSYTREDVVEVHCHGGPFVLRKVLESFLSAGARMAAPGEFTLRAFLNGRIDLTRAEAVIDLIRARSQKAAAVALQQMSGRLGAKLHKIRQDILDLLVIIEAYVDFPEEEIASCHLDQLENQARQGLKELDILLDTFNFGRVAREGLGILLVGPPNVGKSSLLNVLLGEDRAIVTPIPGTTRDLIEEAWALEGFPLRLIDTAGIHDSNDPVEMEGMRRTREKIGSADLILLVIDGSQIGDSLNMNALKVCDASKTVVVVNKIDLDCRELPSPLGEFPVARISALTGEGIEDLKKLIVNQVTRNCSGVDMEESAILSSRRHWESLTRCRSSLDRFVSSLKENVPYECLAVELREAVQSLGEVTGETLSEEVLNRIFSRFCIGK